MPSKKSTRQAILSADSLDELREIIDENHEIKSDLSELEMGGGDMVKEKNLNHPLVLSAESFEHLKEVIDDMVSMEGSPEFVEEWSEFNILRFRNRFWGVPQAMGPVDLTEEAVLENPDILSAESVEDLRNLIDEVIGLTLAPQMIEEWNRHNIFQYKNSYWGVPHSLGEVDMTREENLKNPSIITADSLEQVKNSIKEAVGLTTPPEFVEAWREFNVIRFRNRFWGVPQAMGPVDLADDATLENPDILSAESVEDLRNLIDEVIGLTLAPQMIEEWNRHNIFQYKNRYWGVPHSLGKVDVTREENLKNPSIVSDGSLEDIKDRIDEVVGLTAAPEFIEEWKGYNIIQFQNRFWGVPHVLGEVDVTREGVLNHPFIQSAGSLQNVKDRIDEAIGMTAPPIMVEEWNRHNIIQYKNRYWGVPHSLGEVDMTREENLKNPSMLSAGSLEEVKAQIDKAVGLAAAPEFVEEWNQHNVIRYKNRLWGVPHALGEIDVTQDGALDHSSILSGDSLESIRQEIDGALNSAAPPEFVEEINEFNILKYNSRYWGVPQILGEVNLMQPESSYHPSILSADTLEEAKKKIDQVVGWSLPPEFIGERNGYNLVKYRNRYYGIPQTLGEVDISK